MKKKTNKKRAPQDNQTTDTMTVSNASALVRLAAFFYDALLMLAIWFVVGGIAVSINGGESLAHNNPFMPSIMFVVWVSFNLYFWRRGGQTLGMRAWRLRLLSTTGKPLTLTQSILRLVMAVPAFCCFYLGYLWMHFNEKGLTWHDKYSETRVIQEPKS